MSVSIHTPEPKGNPGFRTMYTDPVTRRPDGFAEPDRYGADVPAEQREHLSAKALQQFEQSLPGRNSELSDLRGALIGLAAGRPVNVAGVDFNGLEAREALQKAAEPAAVFGRQWRDNARWYQTMSPDSTMTRRDKFDLSQMSKSDPLAKAVLDIGTSTNFLSITGGQALGYVSLDTRIARATVRPDSFTLYQALEKSAAFQVVDYWAYTADTGGAPPGSATSGFSSVSSGTLSTNAGIYSLQSVNLKLMLDGRAVSMALMAQNNFVSVNEQENANSALTVLETADWLAYHGNATLWPNQFNGLDSTIPTTNIFDFQQWYQVNGSAPGWSVAQGLFNMIYEVAAVVTSWGRFGRTTHAFMTPATNGSLQSLVTTLLNNVVNWTSGGQRGIVVNGDLQGLNTRFGPIQFPLDLMITARDTPVQGQLNSLGVSQATASSPTPPSGVIATASGAAFTGSNWGVGTSSPYVSGTTRYYYAVAATDANMNESTLTFSNVLAGSGVTSSGAAVVAIGGAAAGDYTAFRVFRTGALNYASGASSPTAVRYIGSIAASGTGVVNFVDANTVIPGGERIYLLDMREEDGALDYRYLLPLTRIELFAQNLYMPWAVCSIGALRNRIPRFHAEIINYIPDNPTWNPLGANV